MPVCCSMAVATASRRPLPVAVSNLLCPLEDSVMLAVMVLSAFCTKCASGTLRGLLWLRISGLKDVEHFLDAQLAVLVIADILDAVAQILAHLGRRVVAVVLLQQEPDAALAALAVDADDVGVVGAADIVGVDRDIGAGPAVELASPCARSCPWRWRPDGCR